MLSDKLLEHHEGKDEEILAIIAHELGHWKLKHQLKTVVMNTVYMAFFGVIMIAVIDNNSFLDSFSITHESYFMTFLLFILFYQRSVDIPLRLLIKWRERRNEYEADAYSVRIGYGPE